MTAASSAWSSRPARARFSLEPGGQFELSGAPLETIHQTCREGNAHLAQVREIAEPMGIRFLGLGGSPKWSLAETPKMPKSRYEIMTRYMPKVGTKGLDMMYRTCTIQVNLDFESEADMRRKMQVSLKLQPLSTALFANSPFTESRPNGLQSWRGDIWRDTDNQRSGLLEFCFSPDFGFADYVEWALDVPMYFVIRDGRYHDMTHITFRQFMAGARVMKFRMAAEYGRLGEPSVDAVPGRAAEALPRNARRRRRAMAAHLRAAGLLGRVALRCSVHDISRDVLAISRLGLKNRALLNSEGFDETHYLASLEEVVARGTTSAEQMLSQYNTVWGGSVEPAFLEYAY
jgi:glutamate--cysteine ligase